MLHEDDLLPASANKMNGMLRCARLVWHQSFGPMFVLVQDVLALQSI